MAIRSRYLLVLPILLLAPTAAADTPTVITELRDKVKVVRDREGIPHIIARNEHDLILMQAWVHARDRLFQMDVFRRQASGTLAQLLGKGVLGDDVELRTLGLRRAAERSLPILSAEARPALEAYAAGVNAFVREHPLPPEYDARAIGARNFCATARSPGPSNRPRPRAPSAPGCPPTRW